MNKVYIVEDYDNGEHYGFSSMEKAKALLFKWYVEGISNMKKDMIYEFEQNPTLENGKEIMNNFLDYIQQDLMNIQDGSYVEGLGYIYEVEIED